jgi:phospholipase C
VSYAPIDDNRHLNYLPQPPSQQAVPLQEFGSRPACALPYSINTYGEAEFVVGAFRIFLTNSGSKTAVFQVRSAIKSGGPWTYTVDPNAKLADSWKFASNGARTYDLCVYAPNGFFRAYKGQLGSPSSVNLQSTIVYNVARSGITLQCQNLGTESNEVRIRNLHGSEVKTRVLGPGKAFEQFWSIEKVSWWYDAMISVDSEPNFQQQFAGHVETGRPSRTDPEIGAARARPR